MTQEPNWKKVYDRLVRSHCNDQIQVHLLERQVRHFRLKRERLQNKIEEESRGVEAWLKVVDRVRREVERYQKHKHLLSPKKQKQLDQIMRKLPMNTLEERVRLMEVSEKLTPKPCIDASLKKAEDQDSSKYSVPARKHCDPRTQSKVDKRLSRINADLQEMRDIHEQTMAVIQDIHDIMATINYLEHGQCTNIEITPYVATTKNSLPSLKATIKVDRVYRSKNKKHFTRELMDVRPPYILDHVPQLKPDIFEITERKPKKQH
ncbi:uncharacterized protein LOC108097809 [Drosophila ficusphila]|uniref:uncharacterized protein LOC108097809 n=1 Tax=Drosophila ficusphila TaxID=30025 RepID=UPI0007E6D31D|nr:uncharacterized protein LOC108097809 [Drosophila ficusphila]